MHMNGKFRDPIIEAFEEGMMCPSPEDVVQHLGGQYQAKGLFESLLACSDILPGTIRDYINVDWAGFEEVSTFGELASSMLNLMH